MGSRGPVPSTHARRRNKRVVNGRLRPSRPTMPVGLRPEAQREWRRIVPILEQLGILTSLDRAVLVRYVTAWADWVELDGLIAQTSRLIRGREGTLVRNPL